MKPTELQRMLGPDNGQDASSLSMENASEGGACAVSAIDDAHLVSATLAKSAADRHSVEPVSLRVLAEMYKAVGTEEITRGALIEKLKTSPGKALGGPSILAAITQCVRLGLIDVVAEATASNRLTGRPSHAIRINAHGLRLLVIQAALFRTIETAASSRASPTARLN
ncbi:MAG: hypothetical protein LCH39_15185 [Proteobacteria bacterium]|nr:hypothetical protein [Pseudomonadota bacterium]